MSRPITRSMGAYRSVNPLINTLPPEILSAIFLLLRQVRRSPWQLPFQVILSHVCQYWRQIAISTPQLWSSITIYSAGSESYVNEWLTRSLPAPLDVRLYLYYTSGTGIGGESTETLVEGNLTRILQITDRIRSLSLSTHKEVNVYHILQLFQQVQAPLLERLIVYVDLPGRLQELLPFVTPAKTRFTLPSTFNGGTPRLAFVQLRPHHCIPPLTNVTTLHLHYPPVFSFNRLLEILRMPRTLVTLSFRGDVDDYGQLAQWNTPQLILPELQNLDLSTSTKTAARILLYFAAPKLKSLRWHVQDWSLRCLSEATQLLSGTTNFTSLKYLTLVRQTLTIDHLRLLMRIFTTPTHILCAHLSAVGLTFAQLGPLLDAPLLEVLALQQIFMPLDKPAARGLRKALTRRRNIKKILLDSEFLEYLNSYDPGLGDIVELDEINEQTFPDYWWISRMADDS